MDEVERLQQRARDRVKEWKETIPGYRESVLESIIEGEMYRKALDYNCDLDYQERCRQSEEQKKQEHSNVVKCVCAKIKELFK